MLQTEDTSMAKAKLSEDEKKKQRITAFVDPVLVTRAKVRGALEGLTLSDVVEKALDAYAPKIDTNGHQHINLKFVDNPDIAPLLPGMKRTKTSVVPR